MPQTIDYKRKFLKERKKNVSPTHTQKEQEWAIHTVYSKHKK